MNLPPSVALRYEIVRKIADGAVAEIFLARDTGTNSQVVLKVLRPDLTTDPTVVGRFLDEARICQSLAHPGVVRHLAVDRFPDGRVYLVTEHLEGEDLATHLRLNGPLSAADLARLAVPLCEALHFVHRHGVVHRDLKPDNVFLCGGLKAFKPMLLDFGLASFQGVRSVKTATGIILATPEYVAPECIDGQRADARSDLYALGVLFFEALSGSPPFVAANYGELLLKHLNELPAALPAAAARLQPIVHRCLSKLPADRYASAADLGLAFAGDEPVASEQTFLSGAAPRQTMQEWSQPPAEKEIIFGSYKTLRTLGEGAMGQVYLARHTRIGRQVALKVLKPEHSRNSQLVHRFIQEAQTVNAINHEHIVEIMDFVEDVGPGGEPRVYCVMELLTGAPLSALISSDPIPIARVLHIGRQICSALAAAHRVGVVHRDIKPDNIFITERSGLSDYVKVLDFGVAKLVTPLANTPAVGTMEGAIIGTPSYMAPEQASGAGVDSRTDLYAVGVVLYQMLTGRVPFEGDVFGKLIVEIMTRAPPPLGPRTAGGESLPPELNQLVMACLAKDPGKRPASMTELERQLAQLASPRAPVLADPAPRPRNSPVLATASPRAPLPEQADPAPQLRKSPVIAIASLLGVLALAGAAWFAGRSPGQSPPVVEAPIAPQVVAPAPAPAPAPVTPPQPPAAAAAVRVSITSTPARAQVFRADTGELLGTTPLAARLELEQPVDLRIELAGYEPAVERVNLGADVARALVLAKKKARGPKKANNKGRVSDESTVDPFENP